MSTVTTKTAVRLSYAHLIEPAAQDKEHPEVLTYSTALLIPKSDTETVKAIQDAIKEAAADGVSKKWGGKRPANLKNPLRDGDDEHPDEDVYNGMWFIGTAKGPKAGKEAPVLLNKAAEETNDPSVIYSGVEARVSLQFYPFDVSGNRGVACSVTAIQSMETGENLGVPVETASSARKAFGVETPASSAAANFAGDEAASEGAAPAESADDDDIWGK